MAALQRRCPETFDRKCPPPVCKDECQLEGINWCPGMPKNGRPPREIREVRAQRQAEQLASDAGLTDDPGNSRRWLLTTTPLHQIGATYGEAGLRERFTAEIASMPEPDGRRLADALALATRLHAEYWRQNEPYINHPLRAAIRIMSHYGIRDPDVIMAALLHDSLNDRFAAVLAPEGTTAAVDMLADRFGPRVAALVADVTGPDYESAQDKAEQYLEHTTASLDASPWARIIKASDFTDHGVGLLQISEPQVAYLADKYAVLMPVLREMITRLDTPLSESARQRILEHFDRTTERFDAILATN